MTVEHVAPPVVGSRPLTTREVATIRAALRAYTVTRDSEAIDAGAVEIDGAPISDLAEIDRLLIDLELAGDVTLTPLHPADVRRI